MRKITIFTLTLVLLLAGNTFAANGQQSGVHEPGTGLIIEEVEGIDVEIEVKGSQQGTGNSQQGDGAQVQTQNNGEEQNIQVQTQTNSGDGVQVQNQNNNEEKGNGVQVKVKNNGEEQNIQVQNQEETQQGNNENAQANQNRVRGSIQNILTTTDYLDSETGEEVSEITEEISVTVEQLYEAENTISNRGRLIRFFAGGDKKSAQAINSLTEVNTQKLNQLEQALQNCDDCDSQVMETVQAQIQLIEQDQERLQEIANEELNSNGMFGWFINLFK
jgi:hypothetical protein